MTIKIINRILLSSFWSLIIILTSCNSNSAKSIQASEFINKLLEIFELENPDIGKSQYVINVDISHMKEDISIIITAFDKWLFPDIDSSFLGIIESKQNIYVFSGYPDSKLVTITSNPKKCKYSQYKDVSFEYDPIWWEIWLFKNYQLNEIKTHKTSINDKIDDIVQIAKALEIDTSKTIEKKYYNEPIVSIDNPVDYIFGYDSLISYFISRIDMNKILSDTIPSSRYALSCIIDSTGKVEGIVFHNPFVNSEIEKGIQNALIGLSGFSIPSHRGYKVKSYYTLLLKK